jgi:hypothetical protein
MQEAGMIGPDSVGDEFDETEEDQKADPNVVYDAVDVGELQHTLTLISASGSEMTVRVDGDTVLFAIGGGGSSAGHEWTVARSAFLEACRTIGLMEGPAV